MKQLTIATLLCVGFSGLGNAAERKIAYEHDENILRAKRQFVLPVRMISFGSRFG